MIQPGQAFYLTLFRSTERVTICTIYPMSAAILANMVACS
jgi:hypothetical protein